MICVILTAFSTHVIFLLLVKVGLLLKSAHCYTVVSEVADLFCQFHNIGVEQRCCLIHDRDLCVLFKTSKRHLHSLSALLHCEENKV
jgi:hypothetical protein